VCPNRHGQKVYRVSLRGRSGGQTRAGRRRFVDAPTAASDEAARRPSVVRQADVDHGLPSVMFLIVTRMSLSSSPVCGCAGLPQPRSSKMPAAETRAAGGTASWLTMPASTLMQSSVCPRASERKSAGIVFRGNCLRGGSTPLLFAQASRVRRGDNHANNIAQNTPA